MDGRSALERSSLIRAARVVLRRSGFEGFKIQLVLKESGLSARTFYRHFADKEEMVTTLIQEEYQATARWLRQAMAAGGDDAVEQVGTWIREILLSVSDPARLPRTRMFSSHYLLMSRYPDTAADANRVILEPLEQAIRRGQETGVFAPSDSLDDAQKVARLAGGTLNEYLAGGIGPDDVTGLIDSTIEFALRALGAPRR